MIQPSLIFKIIIGGDGGVGKTTMLHRYVNGRFLFDTKMTIGTDIFHKILTLKEGPVCSLQLWDFGGQERFRFILDSFLKGAAGAFLMFDLTNYISFHNLPKWLNIVRKDDPTLPILLLGSKYDLVDSITVDDDLVSEFVEDNNISGYCKVSSKTGYNINFVFESLIGTIIDYRHITIVDQSMEV
ncbi:MAG: GTP-binding protein [Promethearchaeota archaeon]|nr:MAG: GTP-binding protein [Candidatus Lokiarchaeota archaeon]